MSRLTRADFAVVNWLARAVNEVKFLLGFRSGKHRSIGFSTFEWVRMEQAARDC